MLLLILLVFIVGLSTISAYGIIRKPSVKTFLCNLLISVIGSIIFAIGCIHEVYAYKMELVGNGTLRLTEGGTPSIAICLLWVIMTFVAVEFFSFVFALIAKHLHKNFF